MEHESTASGASVQRSSAWNAPAVVIWGAAVGVGAALAGFFDGIVLMVKRAEGRCYVETGSFPCKVHPRLAEGVAISAISVGVGVVVLLLAYVSAEMLRRSDAHER